MKIGLVCPYNLYKGGGVQACVFALQRELSKRGHKVIILTPQARSSSDVLPKYIRVLGAAADVKSPFHTTTQVSVHLDPRQLDDLLKAEQFDLIHFHEPWVPFLARQVLARSNAKNVATFHAKLPDTFLSKTIERAITPYTKSVIKHLDGLTAVSEAAAEYIRDLTDREVEIIPNGIDVTDFQTDKVKQTKNILYIGRLEKRKGVRYLLEAFSLLQNSNPEMELLIAGDGPDKEKLIELKNELKLKRVSFLGFVSEVEKRRLLGSAAVFCSPALYGESFGIVLLEAMAAGVPIVAGDNPGYLSVLQGRGTLSLVNPQDTVNFARRLQLFATERALRQVMVDWADTYVQQFDYEKIVDRYERLYKLILET